MKNIKTYRESLMEAERVLDHSWDSNLLHSVEMGETEHVANFLRQGADPNKTDSVGQPVLQLAIHNDEAEIVKLLIDAGADVNRPDDSGQTPIHWAAFSNAPKSAKLLIDNGANLGAETPKGTSALTWAVSYESPEVAKMILLAGEDPSEAFDGPQEILDFFEGEIDWWPEGELKAKIKRMQREEDLFGSDF